MLQVWLKKKKIYVCVCVCVNIIDSLIKMASEEAMNAVSPAWYTNALGGPGLCELAITIYGVRSNLDEPTCPVERCLGNHRKLTNVMLSTNKVTENY